MYSQFMMKVRKTSQSVCRPFLGNQNSVKAAPTKRQLRAHFSWRYGVRIRRQYRLFYWANFALSESRVPLRRF